MLRTSTLTAAITLMLLVGANAAAQTPARYIPYKGQLERDGEPVSAALNMSFALHDALTGGNQLHTETQSVNVTGGNFSVRIGPVAESVFNVTSLYLAITVDGTLLGGRQLIQTTPYALRGQPGLPFRTDQLTLGQGNAEMTLSTRGDNTGPILDVPGTLSLGLGIESSRLAVVNSVAPSNANHFGNGFLSGTFLDPGGTIILFVSASAFVNQVGRMQMTISVDGQPLAPIALRQFANATGQHLAFPSIAFRLDRSNLPNSNPTPQNPVSRTIRLEPIDCGVNNSLCSSPIVTTRVDQNDFGSVTVIRLPTRF